MYIVSQFRPMTELHVQIIARRLDHRYILESSIFPELTKHQVIILYVIDPKIIIIKFLFVKVELSSSVVQLLNHFKRKLIRFIKIYNLIIILYSCLIFQQRSMIVSPIIDVISMDSFDYMGSSSDLRGGIQFFHINFSSTVTQLSVYTAAHCLCYALVL